MDSKTRARVKKQILNGSIYKKKRYINWRKKVFSRDRYKCQLCGKVGGSIQAHHIKPKYKYTSKIHFVYFEIKSKTLFAKREAPIPNNFLSSHWSPHIPFTNK